MRTPPTFALAAATTAIFTIAVAATAQTATKARGPRLPGSVEKAPSWLKPAPFDVDAYLKTPPDAANAAPLYLDALAEFDPGMAVCFPPDERARVGAAGPRQSRANKLYDVLAKDPTAVKPAEADAVLAEYREGFRKLAAAQARTECVFPIGIDLDTIIPHAQAARYAGRVLSLKADRDLARGDLAGATEALATDLRLDRDLRPRGGFMAQLVGAAMHATAVNEIVLPILGHPKVTGADCDRLLSLWKDQVEPAEKGWDESVKGHYVMTKGLLRMAETGAARGVGKDGETVERKLGRDDRASTLAGFAEVSPRHASPSNAGATPKAVSDLLARYGPREFAAERQALDDVTRAMLAAGPVDRKKAFADWLRTSGSPPKGQPPTLMLMFLPDYAFVADTCARDLLYVRAAIARVAVRRWQLAHDGRPVDLDAACRDAGLRAAPVDPFSPSGGPLKLAKADGKVVIYSIGTDGRDDQGAKDADLGRKPEGDFLFALPDRKTP